MQQKYVLTSQIIQVLASDTDGGFLIQKLIVAQFVIKFSAFMEFEESTHARN
jgi:hypothetical protein